MRNLLMVRKSVGHCRTLGRASLLALLVAIETFCLVIARCSLSAEPMAAVSASDKRIVAALDHRVNVEFDRMPLRAALKHLARLLPDELRIPLRIDKAKIAAELNHGERLPGDKFDLNVPVTLWAKNARLSSVLSRMLRLSGLDWTISSDGLLMTTQEVAQQTFIQRQYDVTDVVRRQTDASSREKMNEKVRFADLRSFLLDRFWPAELVSAADHRSFTLERKMGTGFFVHDRQSNGAGYALVIAQTRQVHEHVAAMLQGLRSDAPPTPVLIAPEMNAALQHRLSLDVNDMPLIHVIRLLEDALPVEKKIPLEMDLPALADAGTGGDVPVTFRAHDIPLQSALACLLGPLHLAAVSRDEAILITTVEKADAELVTRVYNVSELVAETDNAAETEPSRLAATKELLDLLSSEVASTSWEQNGGPGKISYYVGFDQRIAISHVQGVHGQIAVLLDTLRRTANRPATLGKLARTAPVVSAIACLPPEIAAFQQRVTSLMARPVSVDFDKTPFADAIRSLENEQPAGQRISFVIDGRALEEARVGLPSPVTLHVKNDSLGHVLKVLLGRLDLAWIAQNDVLLITTTEKEYGRLSRQVYIVSDLVGRSDPASKSAGKDPLDQLVEIISTCVYPTAWDEVGGPGSVSTFRVNGQRLVITQIDEIHQQIVALFAQLRSNDLEPAPTPAEQPLTAALEHRISVNLKDVPLKQAIDVLQDALPAGKKISIQIHDKALEDAGSSIEDHVTLRAFNVRFRSALALLLRPMDLMWMHRDDVLLITTREKCDCELLNRIYNVEDLLVGGAASRTSSAVALGRLDILSKLMQEVVAPTTWDAVGGPGSILRFTGNGQPRRLVVSQAASVHEEIRKLLADLRAKPFKPGANPETVYIATAEDRKRFADALDSPLSADFDQLPLSKAVQELSDRLPEAVRVSVVLDWRALQDGGIEIETPVTLHSRNNRTTLRAALTALLRPLELAYVMRHDVLLVTTAEKAEAELITEAYDVTDRVAATSDADSQTRQAELLKKVFTLAPSQSWDEAGGPAVACVVPLNRCWLVVSHVQPIQDRIAQWLVKLRANKLEKR